MRRGVRRDPLRAPRFPRRVGRSASHAPRETMGSFASSGRPTPPPRHAAHTERPLPPHVAHPSPSLLHFRHAHCEGGDRSGECWERQHAPAKTTLSLFGLQYAPASAPSRGTRCTRGSGGGETREAGRAVRKGSKRSAPLVAPPAQTRTTSSAPPRRPRPRRAADQSRRRRGCLPKRKKRRPRLSEHAS